MIGNYTFVCIYMILRQRSTICI